MMSVDATSDAEENSRDDDNKSLCDDGEFTAFQWELQSKKWYWGNVSKDALAIAMQVNSKKLLDVLILSK